MDRIDHLLIILAEECAEVSHRCSKALRFGLSEIQEGQDHTNAERIMQEYDDLKGVLKMLMDEGALRQPNARASHRKIEKVEKYLKYSKSIGK